MIDIKNLSVQFTGDNLFENVNLRISKHDKISLVGSNGTGKSTFLKILTKLEQREAGEINMQRGLRIGYLPQELIAFKGKTLFDEVKQSLPDITVLIETEKAILASLDAPQLNDADRDELLEKLGEIHEKKEAVDFYSTDFKIEKVLEGLGFSEKDFHRLTEEFSGGWQMRIQLAKILLAENDLIIMDEPTNHLDIDTLRWLENFLINFKGGLIIVSHDRHFINAITNKTLEIFDKSINFFPGNYDAYLKYKEERDIQLRALQKNLDKKRKETERFIERFRYKSSKAKQVQSRIKQVEKMESVEISDEEKRIEIKFPDPPKSGIVPVELKNVSKYYGNLKVFENIDLAFERGDKVAIVGPNGAGKTTLAKIIAGKINQSYGDIIVSPNTVISYFEQEVVESLNPEDDLLDSLDSVGAELSIGQIRTILGSFLFSGDDVFKKIKVLSGGEKSRVALSRLLITKSNFIILDEPTNHLDYYSKEILQHALMEFPGTLLIVSHDIDFLKPIISKVLEIRDNRAKLFIGGIDYYLFKKEETDSNDSIQKNEIDSEKINRKELKRTEAELRQKRYNLTKGLKKDLGKIEGNIKDLELRIKQLEEELADPKIFTSPQLVKDKNFEYDNCKKELEYNYDKWSEISLKIEEAEQSIS